MAEEAARSRLGRGLAALIGDVGDEKAAEHGRAQKRIPIEFVHPNPHNPRRLYPQGELDELAASIRERGIIQPIVVRPSRDAGPDRYEIIAGERRWRAAQQAGVHEVAIVVLDVNDREALELAIVENVQRADLNPLEEAAGYQALEQFGHSQDQIARTVGKSRSHVTNTVRLLRLPESVKAYLRDGKISAGHARVLIGQPDPEAMARAIVEQGLNVRQIEAIAQDRASSAGKSSRRRQRTEKSADTLAVEKRLCDALGLAITLDHRGNGGELKIRYRSLDQLDEIIRRLERR
jgi:ParB family transcriptional regulator, chromosome partitioning protein